MSKLQALREKRSKLAAAMRVQADKMNAAGFVTNAEDSANWDAIGTDYNAAVASIEREETATRVEAEFAGSHDRERVPAPLSDNGARGQGAHSMAETEAMRELAFGGWIRSQMGAQVTQSQLQAASVTGLNMHAPQLRFNLLGTSQIGSLQGAMLRGHSSNSHQRATDHFGATLSNQSGPSGGFLIPPMTLNRSFEVNMLAYGGMMQSSEIISTSSGERMGMPTGDDTSNKGVRLGSNTQAGPPAGGVGLGVDPTFGQVYWDAYKYFSRPILVPYELLQDAFVNIAQILGEMLGERIGRVANDDFTFGTGNAQPMGIVTRASTTATQLASTKAGQIVADDFMKLEHAIDPAYRNSGENFGYMMNDAILLQTRLLKDANGIYLFKSGADFGTPDKINGRQIYINQSMTTSVATGSRPILVGQFRKYKIRRVNELRMYRLEERYRDTDQDGFMAFVRMDGNLLQAGTPVVKSLLIG